MRSIAMSAGGILVIFGIARVLTAARNPDAVQNMIVTGVTVGVGILLLVVSFFMKEKEEPGSN